MPAFAASIKIFFSLTALELEKKEVLKTNCCMRWAKKSLAKLQPCKHQGY